MELEVVLNALERQTNELKESDEDDTYLKSDDDIDFAHLLFIVFRVLRCRELSVECVRDDEADEDHDLCEHHDFEVLGPLSGAARDEIVTPLLDEPVKAAVEEQESQSEQLVDVKGIPQHER